MPPRPETYIENEVLKWYIMEKTGPTDYEAETTRLWNTIVHHYFQKEDGFTTTAEKFLTLNNRDPSRKVASRRGRADLFTTYWKRDEDHPKGIETELLVVECKRAKKDSPNGWIEAETQLLRYVDAANSGEHAKRYGIVAIGRQARIFRYEPHLIHGNVVGYTWTTLSSVKLDLERDSILIDKALRSILANRN
ncbi:hypothetical protein F5Y16DRAFT_401538 [Xylariaceae sp. FL0255]|nr:hypothetical protein F5Y16DRAFT_401538 [Xylariaceae sp. FL0255]